MCDAVTGMHGKAGKESFHPAYPVGQYLQPPALLHIE